VSGHSSSRSGPTGVVLVVLVISEVRRRGAGRADPQAQLVAKLTVLGLEDGEV